MQGQKVRQHYVPQFYLNNFIEKDGYVYCYRKGNEKLFHTQPKNICFQNNLYETEWEDETKKLFGEYIYENRIENLLTDLEGNFSSNLKSIISKCLKNKDQKNALVATKEELRTLANMVANLIVRNPFYIDSIDNSEETKKLLQLEPLVTYNAAFNQRGFGSIMPAVRYTILKHDIDPMNYKGLGARIAEELINMNYCFFYSESGFITSDFPVSYSIDRVTKDSLISATLALHPNIVISFSTDKKSRLLRNRICIVDKKFANKINMDHIMNENASILISNNTELLNSILHTRKEATP